MRHPWMFLAVMLYAATVGTPVVWAQSADTGILGTVADASGAVIPGSTVTITNSSTGVVQSVVSGPNGAFEVRYLVPGDYVVEAVLSGFRTDRRSVALRLGQMARLGIVLQVGDIGEVVDVVAQGLLLETQSGVTGNVVTAETIANLPLSGRNFTALGNLTAGVVASGSQFARQRGSRHVSAGLLRRRHRAQQSRQQPAHVPLGRRDRGVQGAGHELHGGVRRACRRQRAGAAQVGEQRVSWRGVRLLPG